jgi:hypothetical protein
MPKTVVIPTALPGRCVLVSQWRHRLGDLGLPALDLVPRTPVQVRAELQAKVWMLSQLCTPGAHASGLQRSHKINLRAFP